MLNNITAVIFDLGGVLIDWNPKYLYKKIFSSEEETDQFLSLICTSDWNETQDEGRSLTEGTDILVKQFPEYEKEIRAYYDRWEEMLGGVIEETLDILRLLKAKDHLSLYALTNWSAETIPIALKRFDFFDLFDGIVVSGEEKMRKPSEKFYRLILDRYHLSARDTLFIDDNLRNIEGAKSVGLHTIHFNSPGQLRQELETEYGL